MQEPQIHPHLPFLSAAPCPLKAAFLYTTAARGSFHERASQSLFPLTRRSFLAGSALLLGASALEGLDGHTLPVKNTAWPRGADRNLLAKQCSPEALKQRLIPLDKYKRESAKFSSPFSLDFA